MRRRSEASPVAPTVDVPSELRSSPMCLMHLVPPGEDRPAFATCRDIQLIARHRFYELTGAGHPTWAKGLPSYFTASTAVRRAGVKLAESLI